MKKVLILLLSLVALSCSLDDENEINYHNEVLPVTSANVPEYFIYGEEHEITVTYTRPSTCYAFNNIYYKKNGTERIVAVINNVYDNASNCSEISEEMETSFIVEATQEETYTFKFWQGLDDNGNDTYLIIQVPVEQ